MDRNCPPAGVDTVSVAWRSDDASDLIDELRPAYRAGDLIDGPRGAWLGSKPLRSGARVMAWPSAGLVAIEGRLAALVDGSEDSHRLADGQELTAGAAVCADELAGYGVTVKPDRAAVRRLDLAGELHFDDRREGLGALDAFAAVEVPGLKTDVVRFRGRTETVYYRTPQRFIPQFRAYDKGVESETAEPGERVRLERQMRFQKTKQRSTAQWAGELLATAYTGRLAQFAERDDLLVATPEGARQEVLRRVAADELTPRVAERLLGTLSLWSMFGASWSGWSDKTGQRRRRELRQLGIALDTHGEAARVIPFGSYVASLRDSWAA